MRCDRCGKAYVPSRQRLLGEEVTVWRCPRCGEELVGARELAEVQKRVLGRLDEERRIVQVGNSLAVTLPRRAAELLGIRKGDAARVTYDIERGAFLVDIISAKA